MNKVYFKVLDVNEYGWYAYAEDDIFILGDDYPHEGGELYRGEFKEDKIPYFEKFKRDCPESYNNAVEYFNSRPKNNEQTITEHEKEIIVEALNHYASYCRDMYRSLHAKGYEDMASEYHKNWIAIGKMLDKFIA
jgi:hypothetical protein